MVSTRRLKLTPKKSVGGQTSLSSLIRNAATPDLDINGLLLTFATDIAGATRAYDLTSKVPREILSPLSARRVVAFKMGRPVRPWPDGPSRTGSRRAHIWIET